MVNVLPTPPAAPILGTPTFDTDAGAFLAFMKALADDWNGSPPLTLADGAGLFTTYGGTANTITLATTGVITAAPARTVLRFRAAATNTGATTINFNGEGAIEARTVTGVALPAGYIRTDVDTVVVKVGATWRVMREAEYGSNGNGAYVRYDNGTQICYAISSNITCAAAFGSVFRGLGSLTNWPIAFVNSDVKFGSGAVFVSGSNCIWPGSVSVNSSSYTATIVAAVTGTVGQITLNARGLWY